MSAINQTQGTGRFLQFSGMRVVWNPSANLANKIISISIKRKGSNIYDPIDLNAVYDVASISFIRRGGDDFQILRDHAIDPMDTGPSYELDVINYVKENSPLCPAIDGRYIYEISYFFPFFLFVDCINFSRLTIDWVNIGPDINMNSTKTTSKSSASSDLTGGAIAGIVVGIIVAGHLKSELRLNFLVVLILLILFFYIQPRKKETKNELKEMESFPPSNSYETTSFTQAYQNLMYLFRCKIDLLAVNFLKQNFCFRQIQPYFNLER
jgi:hypothetical protein